jgi:hypothetical protein
MSNRSLFISSHIAFVLLLTACARASEPKPTPTKLTTPIVPTVAAPEMTAAPEATPAAQPQGSPIVTTTVETREGLPSIININAASIASVVKAEARSLNPNDPNAPPGLNGLPQHIRISFGEDKLTNDFLNPRERQILVIPLEEYRKLYKNEDQRSAFDNEIDRLKSLLKDKPGKVEEPITVMPPLGAQQVFHLRLKYIDFNGGNGIRFITHYAQNIDPVTNASLFYTFQGMTSDGKYYLSAFIPLETSALPKDLQSTSKSEQDEAANLFDVYINRVAGVLNNLKVEDFKPNLIDLDSVMQSLEVKSDVGQSTLPVATEAKGRATTLVNLRTSPSTRSRVIGQIRRGNTVSVLGRDATSRWLKIETSRGSVGWASAQYFSDVDVSQLPELK